MDHDNRRHLVARGYAAVILALRPLIPVAWIAAVVWASMTLPDLASAPTAPLEDLAAKNGAASQAQARAIERFGFPLATDTSVVQRDPRGLSPAAQRRQLLAARAVLERSDPALKDIRAALPISNAARGLAARERNTTAITYLFFDPSLSLDARTAAARTYAQRALGGSSGAVVGVTGAAPARLAQFTEIERALPIIEAASVALIAVIVGLAFRSIGAPLLTLFTAAITFLIAVRVLPWAGERAGVTVPKEVQPIIVVLLLGLVTDYAIFFLSSMRRRLRQGEPKIQAARGMVTEVAPIVFTAGLIVAAGTAALVAGKLEFFRAFGPGLALTTLISMVVAITLVPALLALFGDRLFGRRVREEGAAAALADAEAPPPGDDEEPVPGPMPERATAPGPPPAIRRGPLARLALAITRPVTAFRRTPELAREHGTAPWRLFLARIAASRPVALPIAIVAIVALGFGASEIRETKLGLTFIQALPANSEVRRAADAAQQGFAPGILAPTEIDVEAPGIGARRAELTRLEDLIARRPGVAAVIGPREQIQGAPAVAVSRDGQGARFAVVLDEDPLGAPAIDRFRALRDDMPGLVRQADLDPRAQLSFGGETALADDTVTRVLDDLKRVSFVAIVVNVLLLALFMRALVAPLYLVACSVLGLLASLGVTTLLFQQVLGEDDLTYYVPFAAAVLLVALGSDYNVFVAGRIWDEARRLPLAEALAVAMPAAARAVTAAGVALAASFALLAIVPLRSFREFAFVMAAGVLIDTFVVRSMLVPALTALFGEAAWWPGRRVARASRHVLVGEIAARSGLGPGEAERAARAALCTLAERVSRRETRSLAAQLPAELSDTIRRAARRPERFSAEEFLRRMSEREGVSPEEARRHARAVMTTLEDSTTDHLAYIRAQLSPDFEELFEGPTDGRAAASADEPDDRAGEPRGRVADRERPAGEPERRTGDPGKPGGSAPTSATTDRSARRD
ncbi:MAG: putative drug exporter of the superfamily [Solirubrobacteraceae bacterium]|nr:putative drug exporter of the superfamily [Solirubrobacteraceae bacterium]